MKYRKRPLQIEAMQFNGKNTKEVKQFTCAVALKLINEGEFVKVSLEAFDFTVKRNDYILKDDKNIFYIMNANDFLATYEPVEDNYEEQDLWA